jgi:ADP-ribose pyrophosphatase YjhB (NUDIX family)
MSAPHPSPPEERGRLSGPVIRRLLHTYWRITRGLTLGVRAAVLDGNANVFLVRHTYIPGWHLPGGGVETGETALDALVRELREEAAIEAVGAPTLAGIYFNRNASRRDHVLLYVVREFQVIAAKQPDREIAEAGFFPMEGLPDGTSPATHRRIAEIRSGSPPDAIW